MNGELSDIQQKEIGKLIELAPEMLKTLKYVNNYFIDLQNKCALTNSDERAWKQTSKILNQINQNENTKNDIG